MFVSNQICEFWDFDKHESIEQIIELICKYVHFKSKVGYKFGLLSFLYVACNYGNKHAFRIYTHLMIKIKERWIWIESIAIYKTIKKKIIQHTIHVIPAIQHTHIDERKRNREFGKCILFIMPNQHCLCIYSYFVYATWMVRLQYIIYIYIYLSHRYNCT